MDEDHPPEDTVKYPQGSPRACCSRIRTGPNLGFMVAKLSAIAACPTSHAHSWRVAGFFWGGKTTKTVGDSLVHTDFDTVVHRKLALIHKIASLVTSLGVGWGDGRKV